MYRKEVRALLTLKTIFDNHSIPFWLDFGILLGVVREGKMIDWDNDIDLGTWINDVGKIAKTQVDFNREGYELYMNQGHYVIRELKTKEHLIDIFPENIIKGYMVHLHFTRPFRYITWMLFTPECKVINYDFGYDAQYIPFWVRKFMVRFACKLDSIMRRKLLCFVWKMILFFRFYVDERVLSPIEYIGDFSKVRVYDKNFQTPYDTDGYLRCMYGAWRVPDKGGRPSKVRLKTVLRTPNSYKFVGR